VRLATTRPCFWRSGIEHITAVLVAAHLATGPDARTAKVAREPAKAGGVGVCGPNPIVDAGRATVSLTASALWQRQVAEADTGMVTTAGRMLRKLDCQRREVASVARGWVLHSWTLLCKDRPHAEDGRVTKTRPPRNTRGRNRRFTHGHPGPSESFRAEPKSGSWRGPRRMGSRR